MISRRDILTELYNGSISKDEAEDIFEQIIKHMIGTREVAPAPELLGMSHQEWMAHGDGVGLVELAKWRYEGWPDVCPKCGKKIDITRPGWFAKRKGKRHALFHLSCLGLTDVMQRDILTELRNGSISKEEAYAIYNRVMDSSEAGPAPELLGMSHQEWSAWGYGVGFAELAKWRHEGWPDICPKCGKKIDITKPGWFVKKKGKRHVIFHAPDCLG